MKSGIFEFVCLSTIVATVTALITSGIFYVNFQQKIANVKIDELKARGDVVYHARLAAENEERFMREKILESHGVYVFRELTKYHCEKVND